MHLYNNTTVISSRIAGPLGKIWLWKRRSAVYHESSTWARYDIVDFLMCDLIVIDLAQQQYNLFLFIFHLFYVVCNVFLTVLLWMGTFGKKRMCLPIYAFCEVRLSLVVNNLLIFSLFSRSVGWCSISMKVSNPKVKKKQVGNGYSDKGYSEEKIERDKFIGLSLFGLEIVFFIVITCNVSDYVRNTRGIHLYRCSLRTTSISE